MSSKSVVHSILFLIAVACAFFFIQGVRAEDAPPELKGSGLPLPRYVSLNTDKAYVRSGPAPRYPVKWVYKKDGFPVEIVQEFDVWRKIRDINGDEGWINKALLSDKRAIIVKADEAIEMKDGVESNSRVTARVEPGVIASLEECAGKWCRISTGGFRGWVERNSLWGIYAKEEID